MSPQEISENIWSELQAASSNKQHAWRSPVLATVDSTGQPHARTVVLRSTDAVNQQLTFFTDRRSPKVHDLQHCNRAELVFWCPLLNWQLRATTTIQVVTKGEELEKAWERIQHSTAAIDYLRDNSPGSVQPENHTAPATLNTQAHQLCLLQAKVIELDWLELSRNGNRRLRIQNGHTEWLMP